VSEKKRRWVPNPELGEVSFAEVRDGCHRGEVSACRVMFNSIETTFEKALEEIREQAGISISPNEVKLKVIHDEKQLLGAGYFPKTKEIVINTAKIEDWEEIKDFIKGELIHHYAEHHLFQQKKKEEKQQQKAVEVCEVRIDQEELLKKMVKKELKEKQQ